MSDDRVERLVKHLMEETMKIFDKEWPKGMTDEEIERARERELNEVWEQSKTASIRFSQEERLRVAEELKRLAEWLSGQAGEDSRNN